MAELVALHTSYLQPPPDDLDTRRAAWTEPLAVAVRAVRVAGRGRHHHAPGVPGLEPAVDQQQRRPVAADDRVLAQPTDVEVAAGEGVG